MNYLKAAQIKQDLIVSMQYADLMKQTKEEAFKKTAGKYSLEELSEAYRVLSENLEKEQRTLTSLFALAAKSKM
jgi:hypothetical protein